MLDVLLDALIDTLRVMPILFLVYILLELLEYKGVMKFENSKLLKGGASPIFGSLFGCVPQCGFSVISTDLYSERKISIGALIAVFVATSDEAIPIMLAEIDAIPQMFLLIAVKIVMGIAIGYLSMWLYGKVFKTADAGKIEVLNNGKVLTSKNKKTQKTENESAKIKTQNEENEFLENLNQEGGVFLEGANNYSETSIKEGLKEDSGIKNTEEIKNLDNKTLSEGAGVTNEYALKTIEIEEKTEFKDKKHAKEVVGKEEVHSHSHSGCCHHSIEQEKFDWVHPVLHCLKISAFILIVNLVLGVLIYFITEERLMAFLEKSSAFQPILAVLIGLIPNCASSLVLTELFLAGGLSFGSIVAGLSVNAGLGLIVLFKQNKNIKENLFIMLMLIIPSLIVGYGIHLLF